MDERTAMLFCAPLPPLQLRTDVPVSIGRDKSCEFPLRKSDVSRRHAEIRFEGSHFVFHDLGSTNGSYLNGARLRIPPAWMMGWSRARTLALDHVGHEPRVCGSHGLALELSRRRRRAARSP